MPVRPSLFRSIMIPSPLSLDMLPTTIATWTAFLPPAAALWRRRAVGHDPAAWLGASWLLLALVGSIAFVRYFVLGLSPQTPLTYVITSIRWLIAEMAPSSTSGV